MTRFDFADRFHIAPDAHLGSTRTREFIELEITTLPRWQWALRVIVTALRMGVQ